ncbi:hypothetical protein [Dyadobacter sp. NIV53]|uniref:hypothetical protein n=1 Tax=Dyadobacter sp. NIV53 TaxID=2861765 RepID=UPI001C874639|nr:hypothetical protein [Dyadobacter sp. NIV53]
MKKLILAGLLIVSALGYEVNAQVSVNINIGNQPAWGPTGYDHVDFYYLPDINVYFDVNKSQYVYQNGTQWIYGKNLPSRYKNFDLYNSYKVVMNEPKPYLRNKIQKTQYANYKGKRNQAVIRDSKDEKYFQSNQHPQHQKWEKEQPGQKNIANRNNNGNSGKGSDKNDHNKAVGKRN